MKKKLIVLSGAFLGLAPLAALAQGTVTTGTADTCATASEGLGTGATLSFGKIICEIGQYLNLIIPVLITLGVVFFIWGVAQYVIAADEEAKTKGRDKMIYGIIGLAVIVGVWGIVGLLNASFGLQAQQSNIVIPTIPQ